MIVRREVEPVFLGERPSVDMPVKDNAVGVARMRLAFVRFVNDMVSLLIVFKRGLRYDVYMPVF